jgi:hypothetical protein
MMVSLQIILGLVVGGGGFLTIVHNPVAGGAALLVAGFLILTGINRISDINR